MVENNGLDSELINVILTTIDKEISQIDNLLRGRAFPEELASDGAAALATFSADIHPTFDMVSCVKGSVGRLRADISETLATVLLVDLNALDASINNLRTKALLNLHVPGRGAVGAVAGAIGWLVGHLQSIVQTIWSHVLQLVTRLRHPKQVTIGGEVNLGIGAGAGGAIAGAPPAQASAGGQGKLTFSITYEITPSLPATGHA